MSDFGDIVMAEKVKLIPTDMNQLLKIELSKNSVQKYFSLNKYRLIGKRRRVHPCTLGSHLCAHKKSNFSCLN